MFGKGKNITVKVFKPGVGDLEKKINDWLTNEAAEIDILDVKFATTSGESGAYQLWAMVILSTIR